MTSTNTILTTNYSNFNFDFTSETYQTIKPNIHRLLQFFVRHNIKQPSLESCFQTSMTLFQIKLNLETIKLITYYTYYLTTNYSGILNQ